MIHLHSTTAGIVLTRDGRHVTAGSDCTMDTFFTAADPVAVAEKAFAAGTATTPPAQLLPPVGTQEVWAAGVTYQRSMTARMEESKDAGGGTFYDKVYAADRPELFFKATPHRVAAPGGPVRIRADSRWNVPEPELTLAINAAGRIFGYTIGNDMSSRDIEGENPLYLPQAKVYAGSAALGPALVIDGELPRADTGIALEIRRNGKTVFSDRTSTGRIKRPLPSLADWLFRENSFPAGCYLMTGTGIVPPDSFTLQSGDEIRITIEPVGTLINVVA
ncbi:MAG: fumarylacetoacetate hydrolase family protein [Opitutus sp.]